MKEYSPLKLITLPSASRVVERDPLAQVSLDDAAFSVMTDLRHVAAVKTTPEAPMVHAHQLMIHRGVRLLFVMDRNGALAGVITATDVLGEKPMRFTQARGLPYSEITVADVMTPASMLEAIALQDVAQMRVGHVLATFRAVRRQHLMVAEGNRVRGLFSASQLARQLGVDMQTFEVARTFADIEAALVR
jgi:CBS domain-containing protein